MPSIALRPGSMALLFTLALLLLPLPCAADNMGALGSAAVFLLLAGVATLGFMVTFIELAGRLGRKLKSADRGGAGRLLAVTRVLAVLWYLLALSPVLMISHSGEAGVMLLLGLLGGLPAHIPSIIALVRARRLARIGGA